MRQNRIVDIFFAILSINSVGASHILKNDVCDGKPPWATVYYKDIGIKPPSGNTRGLRAAEMSCMSFPIVYNEEKSMKIELYLEAVVGYSFEVHLYKDGQRAPYRNHNYGYNSIFEDGWYQLFVPIDSDTTHVTIIGQSQDSDFLILDSYTYAPSGNVISEINHLKMTSNYPIQESAEYYFNLEDDHYIKNTEGSGSFEIDTNSQENTEEAEGFWTPLTISLVAGGSVVGLGVIISGAYFVGTLKAKPILLETDIPEPPRTVVIPRVREIHTTNPSVEF